jgi:cbb3-type cytochrome oxidase subunit 3
MREQNAVALIFMALFALAGWFFWLDSKRRLSQTQAQADLQNRLLEKFASPQDVAQFLQTEGGSRFLQGLTADGRHTGRRIMTAMQIGVVLTLLGAAAIGLDVVYSGRSHPGAILGTLIVALGAGFLISAALSYKLSKSWGLLPTVTPGAESHREPS